MTRNSTATACGQRTTGARAWRSRWSFASKIGASASIRELPNIVRSDAVAEYDTFGTGARLPQRLRFGLGAATTRAGLFFWMGLAFAGVAAAATDRRRRMVALFGAVGLVSAIVDFYVSYVGDAIEVNRHLVGPMGRLAVMSIICVSLGIERVASWASARREPAP